MTIALLDRVLNVVRESPSPMCSVGLVWISALVSALYSDLGQRIALLKREKSVECLE